MISELPASRLGTLEHWNAVYDREADVFKETGDEGEIWFGESAEQAMIRWIKRHRPLSEDGSSPTVLDVGCGNGHLLLTLHEDLEFPLALLHGIDYSPAGIELARSITKERDADGINYEVVDWLDESSLSSQFDLILDKGTYDAISLMPVQGDHPHPVSRYPALTAKRLSENGVLLITSCNWTEEELKARLTCADSGLVYHSKVEMPAFRFGGREGSTTVTLAFTRA